MPEAQWRAMGLLAPPTRRQMSQPAMGCCFDCGVVLMRKKLKPWRRLGYVVAIAVLAFAAIKLIGMYLLY